LKNLSLPSSLAVDDENNLIDKLIKGDDQAFESLIRNYSAKMYSIARSFFNNDDDAQECLQKSFIQVFENIHSFRKEARLTTWLHRITVNCALMMIRQQQRHKTLPLEDYFQHYNDYGERTAFTDNSASNLEQLFELKETKTTLNEIIRSLPEKYCNVLLLRDIQELSTNETAMILAISTAAVKTQLHRARLFLKEALKTVSEQAEYNNKGN